MVFFLKNCGVFTLDIEINRTLLQKLSQKRTNLLLVLHAYKSKTNFENVATGIKNESLLLTYYSHVLPALKEVKRVARIFSIYFDNKKLKNETRELAKTATTRFLLFESLC